MSLDSNIIPFKKMALISREDLKSYAISSEDHNEIHLKDEVAKQFNLPGVIAHGMLIAGYIASRATDFVFDEYLKNIDSEQKKYQLKKDTFRFKAMTFPGEEISVGGTYSIDGDKLKLELEAKNTEGEVKTTAVFIYCKLKVS